MVSFSRHSDQDQFGRYWDALVRGATPEELEQLAQPLDPDVVALVARVRGLRQEHLPPTAFTQHLEHELMQAFAITQPQTSPLRAPRPQSPNGLVPPWQSFPAPIQQRKRWPLAQAAIALLMIVAAVGAYFSFVQRDDRAVAPGIATPAVDGPPADWSMNRGNPARTGSITGPGLVGEPIELWRFQAQGSSTSSPAIAAGMAYLQSSDGNVYALDAMTGTELWRADIGATEGTPAVSGSGLYINAGDGALVALDAANGQERWRFSGPVASLSFPVVTDDVLYIGSDDGNVYAIDAASGTEQWRTPVGAGVSRSLAVAEGLVFVPTFDSRLVALDAATGTERWQFAAGVANEWMSTPAVANGMVFTSHTGTLYALDAATGAERWRSTFDGARSVAVAGDMLFTGGLNGEVYALDAASGEIRWTYTTGDQIQASPAVMGDTVLVASYDKTLYALDTATGEELWAYGIDGAVVYGPSVSNGIVYVSTDTGSLYALAGSGMEHIAAPMTGTGVPTNASPELPGTPATSQVMGAPVEFLWRTTGGPELPQIMAAVAVDPQGLLWIADGGRGQFQIFAPNGAYLETWGAAGDENGQFDFQRPGTADALTGIAFAPDGGFYVADSQNRRVQQFDRDRNFVRTWGGLGKGDGQFLEPFGISIAPDGNVYVLDDNRDDVQVFSDDGQFIRTFGGHGAADGQMNYVGWGGFDPEGNFWIADPGNNRIQQFAPDGTFMQAVDQVGGIPFNAPQSLAIDAEGRIFVADTGNHRVVALAAAGELITSWSGDDAGGTEFENNVFVVLDSLGNIYAHDYGDDYEAVQKFRLLPPLAP